VGGLRGGIAIDFHQHKPRRIIRLLQHIETQHAGLEPAEARIDGDRGFECLDIFRLHLDMDVNDQHGGVITEKNFQHKRAGGKNYSV